MKRQKNWAKHLITCHCVLPQYRDRSEHIYHQFVVFSEIDENDIVVTKYSQCNNCGVIHRVFDIMKSEIVLGKDESRAIMTIDDIKISLPDQISKILEMYSCDLATYEHVSFILENKLTNETVKLTAEQKDGLIEGKLLRIMSSTSAKIEPYSIDLRLTL